MNKFTKYLIIAYLAMNIIIPICIYPYEALKCWPGALIFCCIGLFAFLLNKYPDKFAKILVNKVTLFPIQIIVAIFMMIPVILFYFMYARLWAFISRAILKCFWIIK